MSQEQKWKTGKLKSWTSPEWLLRDGGGLGSVGARDGGGLGSVGARDGGDLGSVGVRDSGDLGSVGVSPAPQGEHIQELCCSTRWWQLSTPHFTHKSTLGTRACITCSFHNYIKCEGKSSWEDSGPSGTLPVGGAKSPVWPRALSSHVLCGRGRKQKPTGTFMDELKSCQQMWPCPRSRRGRGREQGGCALTSATEYNVL